MNTLKKNIDILMKRRGIKKYVDLLREIALHLNYSHTDSYEFAQKEKCNFSKMLNNKRPLKYEFIIPLEKILGVPLAKLLNEKEYLVPSNKENMIFDKGLRYYAYLDDINLYENELIKKVGKDGKSILYHEDEFGKTFLDYVIEYGSINGIYFLCKHFKFKMKTGFNFYITEPMGMFHVNNNVVELARLVANSNDIELFHNIFDPYYLLINAGYYLENDMFAQDEFIEIILNNENLFDSLFERKKYIHHLTPFGVKKKGVETEEYNIINPILNNCLDYALRNINEYKSQALKILDFAHKHNESILSHKEFWLIDECGGLRKNEELIDVIIFKKSDYTNINDEDIAKLLTNIPSRKVEF